MQYLKLTPPLVLAPMEKAGIVIFPVEYVPVEERPGKVSPDDRTLLTDKVKQIFHFGFLLFHTIYR